MVDGSKWTLTLAKRTLETAEHIINISRSPLNVTIRFLEGVKIIVKGGLEAAKSIVRLGLGGIISIRKIKFDVKIGLVSEGHFNGSLEVSFLKKPYVTVSFELRLKSVSDMALDLIDMIFPGISGRDRREVETRMKRAFPDFSRKHYFPEIYRPGSYQPEQSRSKWKRASAVPSTGKKSRGTSKDEGYIQEEISASCGALLTPVNNSEEIYDRLLRDFSVVDNEENLGPDADEVIMEANYLKTRIASSQDYRPREEEEGDSEYELPSLDPCPLEGKNSTSIQRKMLYEKEKLFIFPRGSGGHVWHCR